MSTSFRQPDVDLPPLRLPRLGSISLAEMRRTQGAAAPAATHLSDSAVPIAGLRREVPGFTWPLCQREPAATAAATAAVPRPMVPFCDELRSRPGMPPTAQPGSTVPEPRVPTGTGATGAPAKPAPDATAPADRSRSRESLVAAMRVLAIAMAFKATVVLAEFAGALASGSLALLTDLVHMSVDLLAVGIALIAARQVARGTAGADGPTSLELMAVRVNAVILLVLGSIMGLEALQALGAGHSLDSVGWLVGIAIVRLVGSWAMARVLEHGARQSLNLRAVHTHARADMIGSAGMLVGAAAIQLAGAGWIDALLALGIAFYIARNGWHLLDACHDAHADAVLVRTGRGHAHS